MPSPAWLRRSVSDGPLRAIVWILPALVALFSSTYQASKPELWRDEIASLSASTRSLGQLFHLLGHVDASTGFYYLLLHFWTELFGDSATALRLPSALAMTVAAALTALVGMRLCGRVAALAGGLLFALIPSISRYGQEARAYAFAVCFVALATLLLLRALDKPGEPTEASKATGPTTTAGSGTADAASSEGARPAPTAMPMRRGRWVLYAVALLLVGLSHMVALACLAGHSAYLLLRWYRDRELRPVLWFAGSVAAVLLLLTPLLVLGHSQLGSQLFWLKPPSLRHPLLDLKRLWKVLFFSTDFAIMFLVLSALSLLGLRRRRDTLLFLFASSVLPIVGIFVISRLGASYWLGRYMLFTLPAWALLSGTGMVEAGRLFGRLFSRAARAGTGTGAVRICTVLVTMAGLVAAVAVGLPDQRAVRSYTAHDWSNYPVGHAPSYWAFQSVADALAVKGKSGDGVYYGSWLGYMIAPGVQYYLDDRVRLDPFLTSESADQFGNYAGKVCYYVNPCIARAPDRVWVLVAAGLSSKTDATVIKHLKSASFTRADRYDYSGIDVYLYEKKS